MDFSCLVDYLEIGCPCCQMQYNIWFLSGVPPPPERHLLPDPKAALHRELMQCQFCFKSKREGITFFRCGGCQIEIYCSKECQKNAWKRHKEKCALNRKYQLPGGGEPKPMKDLRAFTSKHRPTLSEAASTALDVVKNPKRAQDFAFMIIFRPRPTSQRIETAFFAFGAGVVPLSALSKEQQVEMRGQMKSAHDLNVQNGSLGAMAVILMCLDPNVVNVVMMGFSNDPSPVENPGRDWNHWLLRRLNEGILC